MSNQGTERARMRGPGRVLVAVYAIMTLAAAGRSSVQILTDFRLAPVAYTLSALAAVVYLVATVALVVPGRAWYRVAWVTITFELVFVVVVGTLSLVDPRLFPRNTVWSYYGIGYGFVPLVLPVLGIWFLRSQRHIVAGRTG